MHPYDLPGKAQPTAASRSLGGEADAYQEVMKRLLG